MLTLIARVLCMFAVLAIAPSAARAVDLTGAWHVLVHYRDAAELPDEDQWFDRVWKFEPNGRRLVFTEYPIVVFAQPKGRFETLGRGTQSRVLGHWEPDARQQQNIERGLEVVARGARSKTLRRSPERGYESGGGLRSASTSVIGYHEQWRIEDPEGLPVFVFEDVLGSARTENMQGVTRFETLEVSGDGSVISGRFERDGTMTGSFRMTRSGVPAFHEGEEPDRTARPEDIDLQFAVDRGPLAEELELLLAEPDRAAHREEISELVRALFEEDLEARGQDPRQHQPRVGPLSERVVELLVDDGLGLDEVEARLRRGELSP